MGEQTQRVFAQIASGCCVAEVVSDRGGDIPLGDEATTPAPLLLVQRCRLVNERRPKPTRVGLLVGMGLAIRDLVGAD